MRELSMLEMRAVVGGWDSTEDPLHPDTMGFDSGQQTQTQSGVQCPDGYHYESGTGAAGAGGSGSISLGLPIKQLPIKAEVSGEGSGTTSPGSWSGCTPNGYHHDPSQQGKVIRDGA